MASNERPRYVTKGVKNKVDNILQYMIWKDFVSPAKLKNDEFLELHLLKCPYRNMQMIAVEDTLGKSISEHECYNVPQCCEKTIFVLYDKDKDSEIMMLKSESSLATEDDKI